MKRNESTSKKAPMSTKCIVALIVAGLFVAYDIGYGQMNWILGVFVLAVIGWAEVEMIYALDDQAVKKRRNNHGEQTHPGHIKT